MCFLVVYRTFNLTCLSWPIGLGTTGEVAIIYMEEFQIQAIKTSTYPLEHWYWYVDDSELKCRTEGGVIVFTKEEQHEGSLMVLDLKQNVNRETGEVECTVHYKKTHTKKV